MALGPLLRVLLLQGARLARYGAAAASLLVLQGCLEKQCDRHQGAPLTFRGGRTLGAAEYYETNAVDEPFLHFPAGRSYDLVHGLGSAPSTFHAYLAFSECPLSKSVRNPGGKPSCEPVDERSGGAGFAEGTGNEAMFEVRGDELLTIRNDTCADFYVRVVAAVAPRELARQGRSTDDSPLSDGGTSDGAANDSPASDGTDAGL